jgi:hypothetical protein
MLRERVDEGQKSLGEANKGDEVSSIVVFRDEAREDYE